METKECHNESADVMKTPVKWPIAPDGYIPNSVIRGWRRTLKNTKEQKELDSDEDDDNKDFYIGYYNDSHKGLRAQRRAKKNEKRSFVKWDYRPELDVHFAHEDSAESQTQESKRVTGLNDDKDHDRNKDSSRSASVKGKINGRESFGFGVAFERKWPKGGEEELSKMDTTDKSRTESKKEIDIKVVLKEKDTTKQDKTKQNKERTLKMPHIPKESYNIQTMPADLSNQTIENLLPTLARNIDRKSPTADPKRNVQPQTTSEKSIVQLQKTRIGLSPVESRQSCSGKVQGKEPLVSRPSPNNERGFEVPQSDLREAKDGSDVTKPPSKLQKLSEANKQPVPTEPRSPLHSHRPKPPRPDENPQTISELKTLESKLTRDPDLMCVDQKVLWIYKKYRTGKRFSSKAHGKQFSTESHPSSFRSKRSDTERVREGLGTTECTYQRDYGAKTNGGAPQPFAQTGLWKLIIEGVTESSDQAALQRLIRARPTESIQTSSVELDIEGPTQFIDENGSRRLGFHRPAGFTDQTSPCGLNMDTTTESVDQADLWRLVEDRPTETMTHTGLEGLGLGRVSREITTEPIDQVGLWGPITGSPTKTMIQNGLGGLSPDVVSRERTTESMVGLGTRGFCEFMTKTGPGGRGMGGPTKSTTQTEALGPRTTPLKSTVQTGSLWGVSPERPTEFMTHAGSTRPGVHRLTESITQTGLGGPGMERPESMIQIGPSGVNLESPTKFITQTGPGEPEAKRPNKSTSYTGTWNPSKTALQFNVQTGPGETSLTLKTQDSLEFQSMTGSDALVTERPAESLSHTQTGEQGMGGPAAVKDHTGPWGQSKQTSTHSTVQTSPGDMGTSRSHDLSGLEIIQSMAHTPGFLSSSDPEQFLRALSMQWNSDQHSHRPMPKWRQRLYQLIFLYGFCAPQTARLFASEQSVKSSQTKNQHKDQAEAEQLWEPIPSVVHERVVQRIQFQDILDQASFDFHCVIPLPSINNFITLEKYGETEYGKLLFEWERGDEEEDQMKVVSKSVTM